MVIDTYTLVFLITSIFGSYRIREVMSVFFDVKEANRTREWITYGLRYVLVTVVALKIRISPIMLMVNVITIGIITTNYKGTALKKVLATITTYVLFMLIEMFVLFLNGYVYIPLIGVNVHSAEIDLVMFQVISYIVILVIKKYKNLNNMQVIPMQHWSKIIMIPVASIIMAIVIMQTEQMSGMAVALSMSIILIINLLIFNLYDSLAKTWADKLEETTLLQQNNYYEKQFELMKQSLYKTKALRHDLKNHLCVLQTLSEAKEPTELSSYIDQINSSCDSDDVYARSGNMIVDSIINFKLQDSEQNNIQTKVNLSLPELLEVKSFDMTIILANLLDNAIYATKKLKDNRYVYIDMKYIKGQLIIKISNSYNGEIIEKKGELLTLQENKKNHGIGLKNVRTAVEKYDGIMEIEHNDEEFNINIIMYTEVNINSLQKHA